MSRSDLERVEEKFLDDEATDRLGGGFDGRAWSRPTAGFSQLTRYFGTPPVTPATRFSAAMTAILFRVSTVALPMWGSTIHWGICSSL